MKSKNRRWWGVILRPSAVWLQGKDSKKKFIDVLIIIGIVVCLIFVITGIKYLCKKHLKRHQQTTIRYFSKRREHFSPFVAIPKKNGVSYYIGYNNIINFHLLLIFSNENIDIVLKLWYNISGFRWS